VIFSSNVFGQEGLRYSVIISPQNPTKEITKRQLDRIMLGEKQRWSDGSKIKIALLKAGVEGADIVATKVLHMNGNEFSRHWMAQVFQGRTTSPNYFYDQTVLTTFVHANKGAIGICTEAMAKDKTILLIDGNNIIDE
jgi:ABC-type phosphate transport system substrate-binding protein